MDEFILNVSNILLKDNTLYRVIYVNAQMCVLCLMNCSTIDLLCVQTVDLLSEISDGYVSLHPAGNRRVVDIDSMSTSAREKFLIKRNFIREIEKEYAPTFLKLAGHKKKNDFNAIIQRLNIPKNSAWRYIRLYLQGGLDESVFLPKNPNRANIESYCYEEKTGRKSDSSPAGVVIDDHIKRHFQEALEYYKAGRAKTMQNAFDRMNLCHFTRTEIDTSGHLIQRMMPASERPTFRQFKYYVSKNLSKEEKDRIKTSANEQRNSKRLLLSDNLKNVMGPGDCIEMDEVEVDLSLVSQIDREQTVGRPIVYAMIDVYTRAIISVSVAFDNNSVQGLTNCLMALSDDKVELCKNYGL